MAVELKVFPKTHAQLPNRLVVLQVNVFVLHRPPQTLDEHVIQRATPAVHADRDPALGQDTRKLPRRELAALIRIEYLRCADGQGVLQSLDAEAALQCKDSSASS